MWLFYVNHTGHLRVRSATVRKAAGLIKGANEVLSGKDIGRLRISCLLKPDAVVLAHLLVGPADSVPLVDADFLGNELVFEDLHFHGWYRGAIRTGDWTR